MGLCEYGLPREKRRLYKTVARNVLVSVSLWSPFFEVEKEVYCKID